MAPIGHVLIWGTLILIVAWYFWAKRKKKRTLMRCLDERLNAEKELIETVGRVLGAQEAQCVAEKVIWVNMPKSLLRYIKGEPGEIKETVAYGTRSESWFYGGSPYRYAGQIRFRYQFKVTVLNDVVTGWEDL
ncbi:MAG: hypothetical protein DIU61_013880 [Bacteroidota bacterium]|jgi:hypothetical protein|nr:MAG: hypothetical protein DIU61_19125 [Bacteroidota bacterium]